MSLDVDMMQQIDVELYGLPLMIQNANDDNHVQGKMYNLQMLA